MNDVDLDLLWEIIKVDRVYEDDFKIQYCYLIDSENEEDAGFVQFDKDIFVDIEKNYCETFLFEKIISGEIVILKECRHKKLSFGEMQDLGIVIVFKYVYRSYRENQTLPEGIHMINLTGWDKESKEYKEIMEIIQGAKQRNVS